MKCRMFNVLTALSLLLCVVVMVAWLVSQRAGRFGFELVRQHSRLVTLDDGVLPVIHFLSDNASSPAREWGWSVPYVAYYQHCWGGRAEWTWGGVYLLPVAGCLAAMPLARWSPATIALLRRRLRGQLRGRCRRCGYDLRATPERCPECGEVVRSDPV